MISITATITQNFLDFPWHVFFSTFFPRRLLLEHGADPEALDTDGRRPAELSKKDSVLEALAKGAEEHREIIETKRKDTEQRKAEKEKEVKEIEYPPKRNGPVTRRLVPEKSEKDEKKDEQDEKKDEKDEKKDEKFLELHSSLDIVARPDDFASRGDRGYVTSEVRLQQGSLIVETSDGLFASDEVNKEPLAEKSCNKFAFCGPVIWLMMCTMPIALL